ncbi:MAG: DUF3365 domain-containing protein [Desulfobulbaceae bacterium]|nr:MAG: DUF3365 domain-containing protein [Desulfobulbaceae bacterium]
MADSNPQEFSNIEEQRPGNIIKKQFVLLVAGWCFITLLAMGFDMWNTWEKGKKAGILQARVALEKDMAYRQWNADSGGLYAKVGDKVQPNEFLNNVERDIHGDDGEFLTLVNHAFMTKQVFHISSEQDGITGNITSLRPLLAANSPDEWERKALNAFETGIDEYAEFETIEEKRYIRLMKPLYVEQGCLRCHASQGYLIGDLIGGINARVPLGEMQAIYKKHLLTVYLLYLGVWLVGLAGLGFGARRLGGQLEKQVGIEQAIQDLKLSLDRIDDSVFMFDTNNLELFYANSGAQRLLGMESSELIGETLPEMLAEDARSELYTFLAYCYKGERSTSTFESSFSNRQGEFIPVEIHIAYVIPRENSERFLVIVRDISERKQAEKENESMQTQLLHAQKLESVGQLASGIAHEINTPAQFTSSNIEFIAEAVEDIRTMVNELQAAVDQKPVDKDTLENLLEESDWQYLDEELPAAINQSRDGVGRISSIVRAMKDFSHPGTRSKDPNDLNHLIETTVTVSRNEWKYVSNVETNLDPDMPMVPCLKDELSQVILNLIINAAHAIGSQYKDGDEIAEKGVITITSKNLELYAEIRVTDSGCGIPEHVRPRVFDPFFTTKDVGQGSGQGLAICKDVIEKKHGGSLIFETEIDVGTTFIITLPLNAGESD